ncbi:hypothetical protein [Pontibacter sp. G13]|uniref:hypothetical protein n=1 Tax=Pontibacter sp. G13 TaxID=3074898 RepID=UPI00288B1ABC|nr:hypothetical protein [Pontibacter sp. G13]WNJ19994.1 hypothetical protein RJD25_05880 [Pontibacter sp. G13]
MGLVVAIMWAAAVILFAFSDIEGKLATSGILALVALFLSVISLRTEISKEGIAVQFFPFHLLKVKEYSWEDIELAEVIEYKPIAEYGGWGYRVGSNGLAYSVSGNKGLQLSFKNGRKLLIGTRNPVELAEAIEHLKPS